MQASFLALICLVASVFGQGNWSTSPFNPPSLPLAVKSPYVNVWAPLGFSTTGSAAITKAVPRAWDARLEDIGWAASIRVDGIPYNLFGAIAPGLVDAIQVAFVFTPTRSSILLTTGPINVNMTFLNPIEATDLARLSMPFSYMYITTESNDGNAHDVQIYTDITGEWITGDILLDSDWAINESTDFVYLQIGLTSPGPYQEVSDRSQDGIAYHAMKKTGNELSWQIGPCANVRTFFVNGTGLNGQAEAGHHPVNNPVSCLGLANDLGSVSSASSPTAWTVGLVRDPVVQYTNALVQVEERSSYYWSNFSNIHDVIEDVLDHFNDALSASIALDNKILGDAGQISSEYAEILSLSTRQAMGAFEYTLLKENGGFNISDVKAFMKDMGGIGSGGVNAVDVIYAAMPIYLYLNPAILGYLLSPLMEYQESAQYTNQYAAQDLGAAFPNATGDPQGHEQGIEHSASMLIMSLAHAQASGDGKLLVHHYDLLNGWASYLVNNTMSPDDQTTSKSDGITSTNQTNLALKGIIAIGAMAKISQYTGHSDDGIHYDGVAKQYVQQWTSLTSTSDQLSSNFLSGSSGLIYNLYADKLLQLGLLDSSVYDVQTSFYRQQPSSYKYGIPLINSNTSPITRSDWMMFAAASVSDTSVRDAMISQVHAYASVNGDNLPYPVVYYANNGSRTIGENSPAQGAMFAPLALSLPIQSFPSSASANRTTGGSGNGSGAPGRSKNRSAIIGETVGGIVGVAMVVGLLILFCRRRTRNTNSALKDANHVEPAVFAYNSAPRATTAAYRSDVYGPSESLSTTVISESRITSPRSATSSFPLQNATKSSSGGTDGTRYSLALETRTRSSGDDIHSRMVTVQPPSRVQPSPGDSNWDSWRSEVEDLRREVERIRAERSGLDEAPPSYNDWSGL